MGRDDVIVSDELSRSFRLLWPVRQRQSFGRRP